MGQRGLETGQEIGRNPHDKAELTTAVGAERFHQREHLGLGLNKEAQAEVSWAEGGGPEPQPSCTSWQSDKVFHTHNLAKVLMSKAY